MHLIPLAIALCPDLARLVQELDTCEPLLWGEVYFPREVVDVSYEAREDLEHARAGLGSAGVDDMLGELWVVLSS